MTSPSYKSFKQQHLSSRYQVPPEDLNWPVFENVAQLGEWLFGHEDATVHVSARLDIRTAIVKTRRYVRMTKCAETAEHWRQWWKLLARHKCAFQVLDSKDPLKKVSLGKWRGRVQFSQNMPNDARAEIAESAVRSIALSKAKQLRHTWKWALPYATQDSRNPRLGDDGDFWSALRAIHQGRNGDLTTFKKIWDNHDQRLGLPIAIMGLVYLPKTEELRDVVSNMRCFREEPLPDGGIIFGFEFLHRLAELGWLPESPLPIWSTWCNRYLNFETDYDGLRRAFSNPTIPWPWKFEALLKNIEGLSTSKVFGIDNNVIANIDAVSDAPLTDRNKLVMALLHKVWNHWDNSDSDLRTKTRTVVAEVCMDWLPEERSIMATWLALDLDYAQVLQTLEKKSCAPHALPTDFNNP